MVVESNLPPRYEIRQLDMPQLDWILAVFCHSNCFCSPLWTPICEGKLTTSYANFKDAHYLMEHQIKSGCSLGYSIRSTSLSAVGRKSRLASYTEILMKRQPQSRRY
jgi:hypothetical protein